LAVIPCPNRSETAVTTVIPVVNMPTLSRNSRLVGSLGTALLRGDVTPIVAEEAASAAR
jgi:hypothetical protein